jgi:hypothetical protein
VLRRDLKFNVHNNNATAASLFYAFTIYTQGRHNTYLYLYAWVFTASHNNDGYVIAQTKPGAMPKALIAGEKLNRL